MHTYRNPFHSANYTGSEPVITTDVTPQEYREHLIFKIHSARYDVVKDGVMVTQAAGPSGARHLVDELIFEPTI